MSVQYYLKYNFCNHIQKYLAANNPLKDFNFCKFVSFEKCSDYLPIWLLKTNAPFDVFSWFSYFLLIKIIFRLLQNSLLTFIDKRFLQFNNKNFWFEGELIMADNSNNVHVIYYFFIHFYNKEQCYILEIIPKQFPKMIGHDNRGNLI